MIVTITTDGIQETFTVNNTFQPGKITYQDPNTQSEVMIHYNLNEVLIRRTGEISFQETYILNQRTMGYYRQDGILFKSIVETKTLQITPDLIEIVYHHEIEGESTEKIAQFRLFK